ncbi:MAG: hypothetical protein WA152_02595 [Microgenomates group bacterium]
MASLNTEPPLITVTNPVTYLRLWWQKVMNKEGVDFNFRIHPITAFLISFGLGAGLFGAGRYSVNIPFLKYNNGVIPLPSQTPEIVWKETAFTGKLQYSVTTQKYFLITTSSEAITLNVPSNLDLLTLVGKRIMAVGEYNKEQKVLKVFDAKDLEILPKTPIPIPTIESTPSPTSTPNTSETPAATDIMEIEQ